MSRRRGERDVEDLVRTARALLGKAEQAAVEDGLVRRVATELAGSVDYEATIQKVATLVVAGFADWCFVGLVDAQGRVGDVAVAHADPEKEGLARALLGNLPQLPSAPHGVSRVLRTLEPELHTSDNDAPSPLGHYLGADYPDALRELGARSYLCVPLLARGAALGAITYVRGPGSPPYSADDIELARELAQLSALAIDNALLHERSIASTNQRDHVSAVLSHELRGLLQTLTLRIDELARDAIAPDERPHQLARMQGTVHEMKALLDRALAHRALDAPPAEPRAAAALPGPGKDGSPLAEERPTATPKTVFVAEDDAAFRAALRDGLTARGFAVREAADGETALRVLGRTAIGRSPPPDVVVLDVRMPGCSGLGVLSAMRELPSLPPTILVTGFKDPSVSVVAERLGAYRVVYKPVDLGALLDVIAQAARAGPAPRRSRRE